MKNISILLLLGILIFFFMTSSHAQTIDPYKFYPSAVGNKWRWISNSNSSNYDNEITKDSVAENGRRLLFFNNAVTPLYMVDTSRQVWQIIDNKPVLWYKLDAQSGDSYTTSMYGNIYKVSVSSATANAFGQTVPAKVFSWSYGDTYPNYAIQWLVYGLGFYSTYSYLYNLDDIVTGYIIDGVKYGTLTNVELVCNVFPSEYSLSPNFPNPFNPSTTINYQLPKQSQVTLKIFDVLGREVTTLINKVEEAGYKSVNFDASKLPSGVYFYRIQAGSFVQTNKMLLMR
jgi:hypothetical protein